MFAFRLKIKILINLAVHLIVAMVLVNFVTIISSQKKLTNATISKGYILIDLIENFLNQNNYFDEFSLSNNFIKKTDNLLNKNGFSSVLLLDKNNTQTFINKKKCVIDHELVILTKKAILSEKQIMTFKGSTWGFFWKQNRFVILSSPIKKQNRIVGGISIVCRLNKMYKNIRDIQHIAAIYIIVNTIVLTLSGGYLLTKLIVKPVHKLVRRAKEYKEDDDSFVIFDKEDNEFTQLSRALSSMLNCISKDKKKLHLTIASLEKANIDLKKAQNDIIRAEKLASVGRLSAGIAHEIGNPIGIITGYLELLKENNIPDKEKQDFINRTENEISRIDTIIRQLLDFSRPAPEFIDIVSVHDIISDISKTFTIQPIFDKIKLKLNLHASKDTIKADPNKLRQILFNLVINAADALFSDKNNKKNEKKIIISTTLADNKIIIIKVEDNGCGIPKENIENIFDPFFTTKDPGKGTGLGLSVSFMIIEQMKGKIAVKSEKDNGTIITVSLPCANFINIEPV